MTTQRKKTNNNNVPTDDNEKPVNPFTSLRLDIREVLERCKKQIDEIQELERKGISHKQQKDVIKLRNILRGDFTLLNDLMKQKEDLYKVEKNKRRSRFSKIELESASEQITRLKREIADVNLLSRSSHTQHLNNIATNRLVTMEESGILGGPNGNKNPDGSDKIVEEMNSDHIEQHLAIKSRDKKMDERIGKIGNNIDVLKDIAERQGEIVREQNKDMDALEDHINGTSEEVRGVNDRMKEAIKHVGKFDRVCCDLFCIAIMVGLIILIVKIEEGETVKDDNDNNNNNNNNNNNGVSISRMLLNQIPGLRGFQGYNYNNLDYY